jgi:hypothetical protein
MSVYTKNSIFLGFQLWLYGVCRCDVVTIAAVKQIITKTMIIMN